MLNLLDSLTQALFLTLLGRQDGKVGGRKMQKKTPTTTGEEAVGFQEFVGSSGMSIRF